MVIKKIDIIECPRDAMQGINTFIPTASKIKLLKSLLKCQFHTIDCGSFVSSKYIPQLADTAEVLAAIEPAELNNTKLLTIVANERGAVRAASFPIIHYLGFPFSLSEIFQRRNTNAGRVDAFIRLKKINEIAQACGKQVVTYISMAFGNPYGELYQPIEVLDWAHKIADLGVPIISLADTVGTATEKDIRFLFTQLNKELPHIQLGAHFHSEPHTWKNKVIPAFESGCSRFDSAIGGIGGCPMSGNDLVGNIATEYLLDYFPKELLAIDMQFFNKSVQIANSTYGQIH